MTGLARFTPGWFRRSIGARIIALSLVLLFAVQLASFSAISASLGAHARRVLPDELMVGERVLTSLLDQNAQKLTDGARLLAADYGFRSAVQSGDDETIVSALDNHGARIGATEVALLGTDFALRAATNDGARSLAPLAALLAPKAVNGGVASDIAMLGGKPHQIVLVPMKAPVVVGWVLMGFPLDARLVTDMRNLSALNLTLLTRASPEAPWSSALTSLPPALTAELAGESWPTQPANDAAMRSVKLNGEEFGVHAKWLTPSGPGHDAAVLALVSLSIDEAVRTPRDLLVGLATITLLGLVAFMIGAALAARRVTTPLRELSSAADLLGAGNYDAPVHGMERHDELGHLARAFDQMRTSVGEKQQQILQLAYWDSLTGLPNRVQFRDAVRDAIAQAQAGAGTAGAPRTVAVVMLDLDRFKHVNDVLGYRVGDLLLGRVAERLSQQMVRGGDLVARLGGDEFAVLLRQGDAALAASVAQRIGAAFDEPLKLEEHTVDMGAGIGIACWPQHASDADALLSRAEVAMYAAKRRAESPLMYDPSFDAASSMTLSLLTELRQAVEQNELRLYLQPKLKLHTGRISGAETLVRWQHPTRGLVPPMSFIPFAEQTGFIRTLTMWVFEEAARHWLALQAEGIPMTLSVNLSTRDLLDPDLPQKFDALLVKHRVPAEAFCLEITESAIMDDPTRALATLNKLSELGFRLSIDDFGTGYSSLAYLKRLPVDELKIDKSFVMSMEKDLDDAKIVRSTIDLAHNLGLSVVAEGVENVKAWDMLRELECDEAQGYHMGRPMPATEFHRWSTAWATRQRIGPAAAASGFMLH